MSKSKMSRSALKFSFASTVANTFAPPKVLPAFIVVSNAFIFPLKLISNRMSSGTCTDAGTDFPAIISMSCRPETSFRLGKSKYAVLNSGKPMMLKSVRSIVFLPVRTIMFLPFR